MFGPPHPPTDEPDDFDDVEARMIRRFRYKRFRRLGFFPVDARLLADSDTDLHDAERLVGELGCPVEAAARILI